MATLNQYRAELLEAVNQYSDDSNIDFRLLDQLISNYRVKWFENVYNKFNRNIPDIYFQTLSCVDLELVDQVDCCSVSSGCKILRTSQQLPEFATLSDGELLLKVSAPFIVNKPTELFHIIKHEQAEFFGNGRYNKQRIGVFLYNRYIYFIVKEDNINLPLLEKVNIRGIFRNPQEASRFKDCDGRLCWTPDSTYPMDAKVWNYVKGDILVRELNIKLNTPEDLINDNRSDLPNAGVKTNIQEPNQ